MVNCDLVKCFDIIQLCREPADVSHNNAHSLIHCPNFQTRGDSCLPFQLSSQIFRFCQTASKSLPPSPFVYFFPPRQSIQVLALWIYFLSDIRLDLQNFSFNRHNNGILVSYILDWWTHYINKMISRTTPLWTHYINPIIKGLPNWWTIISRTTPLMDALYKPNNIQDYPIDGRII